jgi:hypothetical protein
MRCIKGLGNHRMSKDEIERIILDKWRIWMVFEKDGRN